jgi:hypothetical protein
MLSGLSLSTTKSLAIGKNNSSLSFKIEKKLIFKLPYLSGEPITSVKSPPSALLNSLYLV